jgi:hypothetical protein
MDSFLTRLDSIEDNSSEERDTTRDPSPSDSSSSSCNNPFYDSNSVTFEKSIFGGRGSFGNNILGNDHFPSTASSDIFTSLESSFRGSSNSNSNDFWNSNLNSLVGADGTFSFDGMDVSMDGIDQHSR